MNLGMLARIGQISKSLQHPDESFQGIARTTMNSQIARTIAALARGGIVTGTF